VLALAGLASGFIAMSWRKWPDPLIDFGRELYIPWRLAHGAVLYRDMDDFYGPLSQYLNAGLFAIFGPGMMVLVAANLVIFAAIVATLYLLFRRAWGVGAALASAAAFIAVFGFSEFTPTANYNYATPYAHEVTHGFLTCLLLVCALLRWLEKPTALRGRRFVRDQCGAQTGNPVRRRIGHACRLPGPVAVRAAPSAGRRRSLGARRRRAHGGFCHLFLPL
jgi:hypothetical protein